MPGGPESLSGQLKAAVVLSDAPRPPAAHALGNQTQVRLFSMLAPVSIGRLVLKGEDAVH